MASTDKVKASYRIKKPGLREFSVIFREVYQAKDETLGRQVATKALPEEFAQDADRVARFWEYWKRMVPIDF